MAKITIKTAEEIAIMKEGAVILKKAHNAVKKAIKVGVTTAELDAIAEDVILSAGAKPSFKGFNGFPATLCTMLNEEVVHCIPGTRKIAHGDLISVDCGVFWKGFHTDAAFSLVVGGAEANPKRDHFQKKVWEALQIGCKAAKAGRKVSDVGKAVNAFIQKEGFRVIKEFTGHGIGRNLHEDPPVYNFFTKRDDMVLKENMVLCIEPIIAMGKPGVIEKSDGWTVITKDRRDACQWEHIGRVTKNGLEVWV